MITIPKDYPVQPIGRDVPAKDRAVCRTCGLMWDDGVSTSITPTPAGRCPFESFHEEPVQLDDFTRAYIECALWSSTDNDYHGKGDPRNKPAGESNGGDPLDKNYTIEDIAPETLAKMIADCDAFQIANGRDIASSYEIQSRKRQDGKICSAGHDFWLNRNGHGAGFWDGDWPEPQASRLDAASKAFGGFDLYVGDDGKIYGSKG